MAIEVMPRWVSRNGEGALFDRDCQIGSPSPIFLMKALVVGKI